MERIAFLLGVKEGYEDEYQQRHDNLWPELSEEMRQAGVRKMSIFRFGQQLFLYMEVKDYAESVRMLAKSPASVRWEEYMAPIMQNAEGDDYDPEDDAFPDGLPEVFCWEA
ncbi:MAG: L-rhamnose mutarotase [Anaerolineales bacterium]|jgi:L-rhamnose mutarotase|nr:L-rhamnose mutarotase [Alphaproteobacteria bacterium]MDP7643631.1 L-rhamnose mutarotase [Anaerolineales bacterium]|tara:strand:+ start:13955 stop:14287 length:333 start_codon:yes stop_codon:yes gene_type:complete